MNRCIFMGRFAADPEVRATQAGMSITRFRLAVSRRFKREGEPDADFINFVAFDKSADNIGKFFQKGSMILVESHMQTGSYEKDGHKVYTTDFVVDAWEFVGAKADNGSERPSGAPEAHKDGEFVSVPKTAGDDLPWD